jgi:ATP-dependent Clp protease adaptor protein ClpS
MVNEEEDGELRTGDNKGNREESGKTGVLFSVLSVAFCSDYFSWSNSVTTESSLPEVTVRPREKEKKQTQRLPPYHVILENDDHHTFEFVVESLQKALSYSQERAYQLTMQAHTAGRAVVWTGPKEVAELKADQIRSFHEIRAPGANLGPLSCYIEPAPGE